MVSQLILRPGSPDRSRGLWDDLHTTGQPSLPHGHVSRDAAAMPERAFPAVDALIRRVQRAVASRPDPMHILAQTISMTGEIGADPYAVLGVLIEGAAQAIAQHIPAEHQMEAAATVVQLLEERLKAHGVPDGYR
jgi:hypothetical protein